MLGYQGTLASRIGHNLLVGVNMATPLNMGEFFALGRFAWQTASSSWLYGEVIHATRHLFSRENYQ
jgi:hypothetical protein